MASTNDGAVLTDIHRRRQVALATAADSEVRRAWRLIDVDNIDTAREQWNVSMVGTIAKYHNVSQQQAVVYLDDFRQAELGRVVGPTERPPFDVRLTMGVLDASGPQALKRAIGNGELPASAYERIGRQVMAETRKLIMAGGRGVVRASGQADSRAVGWRRVSDGDPCTFCAMLVSRGPAYTSEAAALAMGNADPYHKRCGCTVEIIYGDWVPTPTEQRYVDAYFNAAESADADGVPRTADEILVRMRTSGDFTDSRARRAVA